MMVTDCENITSPSVQKQNLNENNKSEIHENMDKILCKETDSNRNTGDEISSKRYINNEKTSNELLMISSNSNNWWANESEGTKLDSRQRWSFGSDISIEAAENIQSRLCCSPVDEFDSTVSSENEDLIVNGVDERDESYKNYIQVSPVCSPTFKKNICSSDNKKRSKNHDVDTADDELIDYSKRYTTDSSLLMVENKHINSSHIQQRQRRNIVVNSVTRHVPEKKSTPVNNRSKVDPFGDYAETDLDQPTDYSLRYAEEDTDEEEKENRQFYCAGEQEDTIKTYYTEGTPYQTPCNFSTATSMSDLLSLEDTRDGDEAIYKRQFLRDQKQDANEKSGKIVKDVRNPIKKKYVSEDTKIPIIEETRNTNHQKVCNRKLEKLCTPPQSPAELCDKDKDNKAVTFSIEENYAQETPLMFSRSSSLDSLSEFEQHSIHDDRSSIISDFSHRTSGAVSPSELPDSPTQTVPPSPGRSKQQNFNNQQQPQKIPLRTMLKKPVVQNHQPDKKIQLVESIPQDRKPAYEKPRINRETEHGSVFEDGLVSFKEESIPNKSHSTTTSLSALTIDDEDEEECDNREIINKIAAIRVRTSAAGMHQAPMQKAYRSDLLNESDKLSRQPQLNKMLSRYSGYKNNCLLVSPTKEEIRFFNVEEENNGYRDVYRNNEMQNNKYKDSKENWYKNELKNENRNQSNRSTSRSPILKRNNQFICSQKVDVDEIIAMDTIRIYCTEDTPTYVSPFGSQSNLSALSMLSISDDNLSYNANFCEDEQPRSFYEEERSSSRIEAYDTDASSDFASSEDDDKCYDDEEENSRRRIDVSPFDSQINLANFSLLCIEEVSEEEDEEETNNETEKSARGDSCAEKANAYKRLSYENSDYSDEDRRVLEECIKSGVSKVTRRRDDSDVDERHLF